MDTKLGDVGVQTYKITWHQQVSKIYIYNGYSKYIDIFLLFTIYSWSEKDY